MGFLTRGVNGVHFRDAQSDVELGNHHGGGSGAIDNEEETFSIYGSAAPLYGKDAASLYKDDASSMYPDASLGSELLSSLKETRINKFLWIRKLLILAIIFSVSFSMIFALFQSLPKINRVAAVAAEEGKSDGKDAAEKRTKEFLLRFPKNLEELKVIRDVLEVYQTEHRRQVQVGIICLYLFLQTFVIPGSIFINILAGSLYGFYEALFLVLVINSPLCFVAEF